MLPKCCLLHVTKANKKTFLDVIHHINSNAIKFLFSYWCTKNLKYIFIYTHSNVFVITGTHVTIMPSNTADKGKLNTFFVFIHYNNYKFLLSLWLTKQILLFILLSNTSPFEHGGKGEFKKKLFTKSNQMIWNFFHYNLLNKLDFYLHIPIHTFLL